VIYYLLKNSLIIYGHMDFSDCFMILIFFFSDYQIWRKNWLSKIEYLKSLTNSRTSKLKASIFTNQTKKNIYFSIRFRWNPRSLSTNRWWIWTFYCKAACRKIHSRNGSLLWDCYIHCSHPGLRWFYFKYFG